MKYYEEEVLTLNTQFKKGVLDMCVLALLDKGDSYGYDLAESLASKVDLSDGTVYPILRKLASGGEVETYLRESPSGPPRFRAAPPRRAFPFLPLSSQAPFCSAARTPA